MRSGEVILMAIPTSSRSILATYAERLTSPGHRRLFTRCAVLATAPTSPNGAPAPTLDSGPLDAVLRNGHRVGTGVYWLYVGPPGAPFADDWCGQSNSGRDGDDPDTSRDDGNAQERRDRPADAGRRRDTGHQPSGHRGLGRQYRDRQCSGTGPPQDRFCFERWTYAETDQGQRYVGHVVADRSGPGADDY